MENRIQKMLSAFDRVADTIKREREMRPMIMQILREMKSYGLNEIEVIFEDK